MMGQKLSPYQLELYQRVDEVLYYMWDPIGFAGQLPRDEYHAYLPPSFSILIKPDATPEILARYLTNASNEHMGLSRTPDHDLKIANLLFEIRDELKEKHAIA